MPPSLTHTDGTDEAVADPRLAHLPVALFSTVMGSAGLAIGWQKAAHLLGWPAAIGGVLGLLATVLFVLLSFFYGLKMIRHPGAVAGERRHPVRMNFFPTFSIGILLLSITWHGSAPELAKGLWMVGATLHLAFTLMTMSAWIHHSHFEINHLNPAWFIPVVGNIIVPVLGVKVAPTEISWFFFSVGLVFWIILFAVVMYRLFFHAPLALRLTPTLFILLAPPSVGFIAYVNLTGELDAFARILYYTALFLAMLLASNALRFFKVPFFVSAWAYSFPLAALSIATLRMAELNGGALFAPLGAGLLIFTSAVIAMLMVRTVQAVARREICQPE